MTLYERANSTNIPGNIEVRVYAEYGDDTYHTYQFLDCVGLEYTKLFHGAEIDGQPIKDMPVQYMFAEVGECEAWLIIEVSAEVTA